MLEKHDYNRSVLRVRVWYGALLIILGIFGVRLFYIQVIQHGHYAAAARSDQLKQYDIPATRGYIEAVSYTHLDVYKRQGI